MIIKLLNSIWVLVLIGGALSYAVERDPVVAKSCFVIESDQKSLNNLISYFEKFATVNSLTVPPKEGRREAFGFVFRDQKKGELVSLSLYMGHNRASTSLFCSTESECLHFGAYNDFMINEVSRSYKVTSCSEVEGFRIPTFWNDDLYSR